jgi:hypothetical protein
VPESDVRREYDEERPSVTLTGGEDERSPTSKNSTTTTSPAVTDAGRDTEAEHEASPEHEVLLPEPCWTRTDPAAV